MELIRKFPKGRLPHPDPGSDQLVRRGVSARHLLELFERIRWRLHQLRPVALQHRLLYRHRAERGGRTHSILKHSLIEKLHQVGGRLIVHIP